MMFSSVCISIVAMKEINMLELETLFMLVNILCSLNELYEYGSQFLKNGQSPI